MENTNNNLPSLRDHMANERTFLAWIRTSVAIMAFGFVVEKFSLFLKQIAGFFKYANPSTMSAGPSVSLQGYSTLFGIILVALGALICLLAFIRYKHVENQINTQTYQPTVLLDTMLTLTIFSIGLFLTIYLLNSL